MRKNFAQESLEREICVVNFAGGGGADDGIERYTDIPVAAAINHDQAAILMHKTNHPYTVHLQEDVFLVDPVEVCRGRPVGLAWFSPDCTHFSRAKGGTPVKKEIRGLSWVIVRWAMTVRPRVMMMENVKEIRTWGPLMERDGGLYPDPDNKPLTVEELREMDGEPVWVEPTQAWRIVCVYSENGAVRLYTVFNTISAESVLRNDGRIYRRPPEKEE